MNILKALKQPNMAVGYLYFYVHFVTEVMCFYLLSQVIGNTIVLWFVPLIFDCLAFVPQSIIGAINDKYKKINFGVIGFIMMIIALIIFSNTELIYLSVILLALGNSCTHVAGAEATLRVSNGHMTHAAMFVGGGSFGVVLGRLLGPSPLSYIFICLLGLSAIPFSLLGDTYRDEALKKSDEEVFGNYNFHNDKIHPMIVVLLATFVVIIRGYMAYGIPTTWNKTVIQTVALFCTMGTGKILGGMLVDTIGIRKTSLISTVLALPFLIFGDNHMFVSILGIMFFAMTMSITLGLLMSVLKGHPGLAFGHTTIGLFLGTLPILLVRINSNLINVIMLMSFTFIALLMLMYITRKEKE